MSRTSGVQPSFRFILDEDLSPEVARVAQALGLDVISVHTCGRKGLLDDEQLHLAARDGRIFVTRNRNDYLRWSAEFSRMNAAHSGVLIVSRSIVATRPEPLAYALRDWLSLMTERLQGSELGPYFIDFIAGGGHAR